MRNTAKNHSIEMEMLDGNESQAGNIGEDDEKEDEENIDISIADSYSHAVVMTRMCWREQDVTDYLQSSVLSHLYHFLQIADEQGVLTTRNNYYNLNLLDTSFRNSPILGISIGISANITDMWKNIYKTALTREQMEGNNKLSNPPGNARISGEADILPRQLIPIMSRDILPKPGSSYSLDLLPPDSDSKTVYNHIHLLLPLNQLQRLNIKTILDHLIKNERNIFFYIDQ